jgi:PEP-CTERM motif
MGLALLHFQTKKNGSKRLRPILAFCWALGLSSLALTSPAQAAFTGPYAFNQFTLTNLNADGFAITPDGGLSIVLTGGNNGSGLPGTTDLIAVAAGTGAVQFHYSYSSLDFPGFDFAGYLVGAAFTQLADTDGQSGNAMFTVSNGQKFGFRVGTQDNTGEPGILTISSFTAPIGSASVPEPGTAPMLLLALAGAAIAVHRRVSRINRGQEENA